MIVIELFFLAFAASFAGWVGTIAVYWLLKGKHAALRLIEMTFRMKEGRLSGKGVFNEQKASDTAEEAGHYIGILYFMAHVLMIVGRLAVKSVAKARDSYDAAA